MYNHVEGCPHLAVPDTGKMPNPMAKKRIRMGPRAKFGNETPSRLTKLKVRSSHRFLLRAERTPAGTERSSATKSAAQVSSMVEG